MANLASLASRMQKIAGNLMSEVSRCSVVVSRKIVYNLSEVTPVDTSTALSNWKAKLVSPDTEFILGHIMGKRGSTQLASIRGTKEAFEIEVENKKPGQSIFISNNADYIRELDAGSSSQQPAGFVERAVLVGKLEVSKFVMKLE